MSSETPLLPRRLSYIKPFQFRPNQSSDSTITEIYDQPIRKTTIAKPINTKNDVSEFGQVEAVSSFYSHEGGDKYLQTQEMEYIIKKRTEFYSFWIWLYLIVLTGFLFFVSVSLARGKEYLQGTPTSCFILCYFTHSLLICGVLGGIYARMTEKYEHNKILIYALSVASVLLVGTAAYEIVLLISGGRIKYQEGPFMLCAIPIQIGFLPINFYFITRAYKILNIYNDILRVRNELKNEIYFRQVGMSPNDSLVL